VFIRAHDGRWTFVPMSPDEGAGGGGDGGAGDGGVAATAAAGKTFTQGELDQIVKDRLTRERSKYGDYDALKAKAGELDQLKAASQSDAERLSTEVNGLKGQNGSLSAENMRLKVALKKGLTGDKAVLAERLTGDTEEAMEQDADKLLELLGTGTGAGGFDGGARGAGGTPAQSMDDWIRRASGRTT
jgi:hypothetical protein